MISLTFPSSKAETNSLQFDTSRLFSEIARRVRVERRASAGAGALSVDLSSFSATSAGALSVDLSSFSATSAGALSVDLSSFSATSALPSVAFAVSSLDSLAGVSDFSDFGLSVASFSESEETSAFSGVSTAFSASVAFDSEDSDATAGFSATVGFDSEVSGTEDSDVLVELSGLADTTEVDKVSEIFVSSALATWPLKKKAVPKRTDAKPKLYLRKEKRWRSLK